MATLKLRAGKYKIPVELSRDGNRIFVAFRYNVTLLDEIRNMEGAKWHGFDPVPKKVWSILDSERNKFQLSYLAGENPYAPYETALIQVTSERPLYDHQFDMKSHMVTRRQCVVGGEMGTGKTLAAIEVMEWVAATLGTEDWLWVGPRSALEAVRLEFLTWRAKVWPEFHTYESLRKLLEEWPTGKKPPRGFVGDEISRAKNPTAKRSQAVRHLTDAMRREYGRDAFVLLMSGTPAPKSPADWWNICEIACPGFLREGDLFKFKRRLAHVENVDSVTGGTYPRLVAWKDSEDRCGQCGLMRDDPRHDISVPGFHMWVQGKNEVANLYKRMSGLVMVKLKKDCLDLPEKRYKIIRLKPSPSTLSAAKLIVARSPRAITALTLLRELSDGFQYRDEEVGVETCSNCKGAGVVDECFFEDRPDEYPTQEELVAGLRFTYDENGIPIGSEPFRVGKRKIDCYWCSGTGQQAKVARGVEEVPCPKEDALKSILEDHEEHGRLVVYAGFTGSVDRCCSIARRQQWEVVRVDGRGWHSSVPGLARASDMLRTFQGGHEDHPRLVFVGQPSSAGMGLTLTASPTICYYSNDFNGESRIQSEDRIHRIGMDKNRGATIIDLIHLDTDQLILDNVKLKRKLQDMTMGELTGAFYAGDH